MIRVNDQLDARSSVAKKGEWKGANPSSWFVVIRIRSLSFHSPSSDLFSSHVSSLSAAYISVDLHAHTQSPTFPVS